MATKEKCERCAHCAEKAQSVIEIAESQKLVDDNEVTTQILDLIINFRHLFDAVPEADRAYATWEDLIESVDIHYNAEKDGEDCGEECPAHGDVSGSATALESARP